MSDTRTSARTPTFSSLGELGEGYGFRKVRSAMGIEAFGANAIVMPPGMSGFWHAHERQDELYFVHVGTACVEYGDPEQPSRHELSEGGLAHVPADTWRRITNLSPVQDLVVLVVGGVDGYVGRDGVMFDADDVPRRAGFGSAGRA